MRKKILMAAVVGAMAFTGCATDKSYGVAKNVYKGGKIIYKETGAKSNKLEKFGKYAEGYHDIRTKVRGAIEGNSNVPTSNPVQN